MRSPCRGNIERRQTRVHNDERAASALGCCLWSQGSGHAGDGVGSSVFRIDWRRGDRVLTTGHKGCTFTHTPDADGGNSGRAVQPTPTGEARKRRTCRRSALWVIFPRRVSGLLTHRSTRHERSAWRVPVTLDRRAHAHRLDPRAGTVCDESRMLDATFDGCAGARERLLSLVRLEPDHRCGLMLYEAAGGTA
jgi:hypothetical protein